MLRFAVALGRWRGPLCLSSMKNIHLFPRIVTRGFATSVAERADSRSSQLQNKDVLLRDPDILHASSLLMGPQKKSQFFDSLWKDLLSRPSVEIGTINKFLFTQFESGLEIDCNRIVEDMKRIGLNPDTRTFSVFIRQSCSKCDMEEASHHLRSMKDANLRPDAFIFSQILYGYAKAGCHEEVTSTQKLLSKMGLWPSWTAYQGLLFAHAELGDHTGLLKTLNEASDVLNLSTHSTIKRSSFYSTFLVKLYVKLMCAVPQPSCTCGELLMRLPLDIDVMTRRHARNGVKLLLANGRVNAALELFKRNDPESADDAYLLSLNKFIIGRVHPGCLMSFWKMAGVSDDRLGMLRRHTNMEFRRLSLRRWMSDDALLGSAFNQQDISGIFDAIQHSDSLVLVNTAIPRLLSLGLTPLEIVQRIKAAHMRRTAAFGCVLANMTSPRSSDGTVATDYNKAIALAEQFVADGYLPLYRAPELLPSILRRLIANAFPLSQGTTTVPFDGLRRTMDIFSKVFIPVARNDAVDQLFTVLLQPLMFSVTEGLSNVTKMARALVDICISENIQFPPTHWVFYALQNTSISQEKLDALKLIPLPESTTESKTRSSTVPFRELLHCGRVDDAVELMKSSKYNSEGQTDLLTSPLSSQFGSDPVIIAFNVLQSGVTNSSPETTYLLKAQDVERIFWTAYDQEPSRNPTRSIRLVADAYLMTTDLKGLADFLRLVSKRIEDKADTLFVPNIMEALLNDDLASNLDLFHSILCHARLSIAQFTVHATTLDDLLTQKYHNDPALPEMWKKSGPEHWAVQVLNGRLQDRTHLRKLTLIHDAIESLCKSRRLWIAHRLRIWVSQLGLLILPRTNELLLITPYFIFKVFDLPPWYLSHELSEHWPVNLDRCLLSELDSHVLSRGFTDVVSQASRVAEWLRNHIKFTILSERGSMGSRLPTWLVVCQRLLQSKSKFVTPHSWFILADEWLKLASADNSNGDALANFHEWFIYSPTSALKSALVLAALNHPFMQSWALKQFETPGLINHLADVYSHSTRPAAEQSSLSDTISRLGIKPLFDLSLMLTKTPLDSNEICDICSSLSHEQLLSDLPSITAFKESLWFPVIECLKRTHSETLPAFFNEMCTILRSGPGGAREYAKSLEKCLSKCSMDWDQLSVENKAFLHTLLCHSNLSQQHLVSPLELLQSVLPSRQIWWDNAHSLSREDFIGWLKLLENLEDPIQTTALTLLTYALLNLENDIYLKHFLMAVMEHGNGTLLETAALTARPFFRSGLSNAYVVLARLWNEEPVNWLDRALIRFYKLSPFLHAKSVSKRSPINGSRDGALDEVPAQSDDFLYTFANTLMSNISDPVKFKAGLREVLPTFTNKQTLTLFGLLAVKGATDVLDKISTIVPSSRIGKQTSIFSLFSKVIHSDPEDSCRAAQSFLARFPLSGIDSISTFFVGPHVDLLFRSWPVNQSNALLKITSRISKRYGTSLALKLACVLVNRGHADLLNQFIKTSGPLPLTLLCGSPDHILSASELTDTLNYVHQTDANGVPGFIDLCVRNAVSAEYPDRLKDMETLIRTLVSEPHFVELKTTCLPPTVKLVADFLSHDPQLPSDVMSILLSVARDTTMDKESG